MSGLWRPKESTGTIEPLAQDATQHSTCALYYVSHQSIIMIFNAYEFCDQVNRDFLKGNHHQRYGQFLMNQLHENCHELYLEVPEEADCFYDNRKCDEFLRWIYSINELEIK
jgi:hypothetical protein